MLKHRANYRIICFSKRTLYDNLFYSLHRKPTMNRNHNMNATDKIEMRETNKLDHIHTIFSNNNHYECIAHYHGRKIHLSTRVRFHLYTNRVYFF